MPKMKVLIRLDDNAQLPWNKHLAKQTNEFREKVINVEGGGPTADQRRIAALEAQIAEMKAENQDSPQDDQPKVEDAQPELPVDQPDTEDPEGTVQGKTYGEWTKADLLEHALEKYNVDLPNRSCKADIFRACIKLEA